jgi:flagellar protein FliO/FliZ
MLEENPDLLAADPLGSFLLQTSTELPPGDYGVSFVKMFLTLIALIILFSSTVWFLRRIIRQRLEKGSGEQLIQILEKKMISPKTLLYVIEMDGQRILLAESQVEVRRISTTKPEEERALD